MIIKKVVPADLDTFLLLAKTTIFAAFGHLNDPHDFKLYIDKAFSSEKILSELTNAQSEFFWGFADEKPAGYIKLNYGNAQTDIKDKDSLEVERLYVLPEFQKQRLGKQLMDFAAQQATAKNLTYIWLGVWEHNIKAINFYQNNGFEQFGSHSRMLGNDQQRDILLKRVLYQNKNSN